MQQTNRRRFLCLTLGAAGALGLGGVWQLAGRRRFSRQPLQEVSRTGRALGTEVTITALHVSRKNAEQAVNAAFEELELVESLLSIYRPASEVSRLNRDGALARPHRYLLEVLDHGQKLADKSGGAFDVTVQPLWDLFRKSNERGLPADEEIAAARTLVDFRQLHVSEGQVRLASPGAAITLNGIAQGFAADRVAMALQKFGIGHALVNAGEMRPLGSDGSDPWTVSIQHPRVADAFVAIARLDGRALSTSGDYATRFSDDYRHHHIFDPRTGLSPTELASVTVVAPTAMQADALSTAVFVLGPERGLELVRSTPSADAFLVGKDERTHRTPGFPLAESAGGAS